MQADRENKQNFLPALINQVKKMQFYEFFSGMQAKLIQTILFNAFMMLTFEKMRNVIKFIVLKSYAD